MHPGEKVNGYYVWVNWDFDNNLSQLKCKKTGSTAKVIKTIKNKYIDSRIISNGNAIYYSVNDNGNYVIYKTNMKGTSTKKIKTVKCKNDGMIALVTCYDGKIYYTRCATATSKCNLYYYKPSTKKTKLVKKNYIALEGYGKYLVGDNYSGYMLIYNVKTGKVQAKIKGRAEFATITSDSLIYQNYSSGKYKIKKCNLYGKKVKTLKTINSNSHAAYIGRTSVIIRNDDNGIYKRYTYKTKKWTTL